MKTIRTFAATLFGLSLLFAPGLATAGHITEGDIEACITNIDMIITDVEGTGLSSRLKDALKRKLNGAKNKLDFAINKFFPMNGKVKHDDGVAKLEQALEKLNAFADKVTEMAENGKIIESVADRLLFGVDQTPVDDGGMLGDGGSDTSIVCVIGLLP